MVRENNFQYFTIAISIYLVLGGFISVANIAYELPYSKWAYNHMSVWLAGSLLAISSLCFIIGAIPPNKRNLISNLLLYIFFITTFLFLRPSYKLAPGYMKTIFIISLWIFFIIKAISRKKTKK